MAGQLSSLVDLGKRARRRAITFARVGVEKAKVESFLRSSTIYRFDIPDGYSPRTLVIDAKNLGRNECLICPVEATDASDGLDISRLAYSKALQRPYIYVGGGESKIDFDTSERFESDSFKFRFVPWSFASRNLRPGSIYVIADKLNSSLERGAIFVIGRPTKD